MVITAAGPASPSRTTKRDQKHGPQSCSPQTWDRRRDQCSRTIGPQSPGWGRGALSEPPHHPGGPVPVAGGGGGGGRRGISICTERPVTPREMRKGRAAISQCREGLSRSRWFSYCDKMHKVLSTITLLWLCNVTASRTLPSAPSEILSPGHPVPTPFLVCTRQPSSNQGKEK